MSHYYLEITEPFAADHPARIEARLHSLDLDAVITTVHEDEHCKTIGIATTDLNTFYMVGKIALEIINKLLNQQNKR